MPNKGHVRKDVVITFGSFGKAIQVGIASEGELRC